VKVKKERKKETKETKVKRKKKCRKAGKGGRNLYLACNKVQKFSYPVNIWGFRSGLPGRGWGLEIDHSPPCSTEVKHKWCSASTPLMPLERFTSLSIGATSTYS
jgi:hypothetical protein